MLVVTAHDGYLLMVSIGEIDPNFDNSPAMLAYAQDGKPLPALRPVFPGDKHGERDVRDVVCIEVREDKAVQEYSSEWSASNGRKFVAIGNLGLTMITISR